MDIKRFPGNRITAFFGYVTAFFSKKSGFQNVALPKEEIYYNSGPNLGKK